MNKDRDNVYLNQLEQDGWNAIQAYHIENESAWRTVAILALLALALVAVFAMYLINQDKHKVVVFEKDSLGNISALGLATKTFNVDNKIIAHQLANFILAFREVPRDSGLKRRNIDIVHKMIDPKIQTEVDQMLIAQYTKAGDYAIMVTLNQIKPLEGGRSWIVNWSEQEALAEGNSTVNNYSSVITFMRKDNVEPQIQLINPIGLFITYLHPVEDINDK